MSEIPAEEEKEMRKRPSIKNCEVMGVSSEKNGRRSGKGKLKMGLNERELSWWMSFD
jgi:hypothetical protein